MRDEAAQKAWMAAWKKWHAGWNSHCMDCGHERSKHSHEAPHKCEECGMFAHGCNRYRGEGPDRKMM